MMDLITLHRMAEGTHHRILPNDVVKRARTV